jgi:hypothetical protein
MHRHSRLLLIGLAATTVLAAFVTSATAGMLSLRGGQQFRAVWGQLEYSDTASANTVRCPVTLEGSFHSLAMRKIQRALIGYVTKAAVGTAACAGGSAATLQESLPWHVRYDSFSGTLPSLTALNLQIVGLTFLITSAGSTCRGTTEAANPARISLPVMESLKITGVTADPRALIPLTGGIVCAFVSGRLSGSGSFVRLRTGEQLSIKLI